MEKVKIELWVPRAVYDFLSRPTIDYNFQLQFLDGLKADLDYICYCATEKNNKDLYAEAAELVELLIQLLQGMKEDR